MTSPTYQGDLLPLLMKRWLAMLVCGALGTAAGVGYALFAPEWYEATLRVIQAQRSHESAALSLASKLPGAFDSMSTDVQRIEAVLTSSSVSDAVIDKFKLDERYESSHRELTRE